jgi:hypothetical protein
MEPAAHATAALVQAAEPRDVPVQSASVSVTVVFNMSFGGEQDDLGEPTLPAGIDFDRWTPLVQPASRDTFRDSLDLLEYEDE